MIQYEIHDSGDSALLVSFEQRIDPKINAKVLSLRQAVLNSEAMALGHIEDAIPSYCALLVIYKPLSISYTELKCLLIDAVESLQDTVTLKHRHVQLSVDYSSDFGIDQERVTAHTGLSRETLIHRHEMAEYQVYMLGFLAGFPYLGGMDPSLETPRLGSPRLEIAAGSVGIAAKQTGIYSVKSPGGWNLIGKVHFPLFDPSKRDPFLLEAGDRLSFKASKEPILEIAGEKTTFFENLTHQMAENSVAFCRVARNGMQMSIQDDGRYGFLSYGISTAGVMDRISYQYLMTLLDEPDQKLSRAVLEWSMIGPELDILDDCVIAFGGDIVDAKLNGSDLLPWRVHALKKGDKLDLGRVNCGLRGYLAIKGGIESPLTLGSHSTDRQNGLNAEQIQVGSKLHSQPSESQWLNLVGRNCKRPSHFDKIENAQLSSEAIPVSVILGPQQSYFTDTGITSFLKQSWKLSQQMNRMGIRLEGEPIEHHRPTDIISDGIGLGAIQVSGNQLPMILLNDRQTIGGYAKIGHVITADLSLLGQLKPSQSIRFRAVGVQEAHQTLKEAYAKVTVDIDQGEPMVKEDRRTFVMTVNGRQYHVSVSEATQNK